MRWLGKLPELLGSLGLNSAGAVSFRNRLINGNLSINQRGTSSASTAYAAGAFVFDCWKAGANGCTLSFAAAANGCDIVATITAGTLLQVMSGAFYVPTGGTYVLSWVGTATARVYQGSASGAYAASPVVATGLTAATSTTVEFGVGTLTLVQFEPGAAPTVFERRDDELFRCQRFYQRCYLSLRGISGVMDCPIILPVQMNAVPTSALVAAGSRATLNANAPPAVVMFDGQTGRFEIQSSSQGSDTYALADLWSFTA